METEGQGEIENEMAKLIYNGSVTIGVFGIPINQGEIRDFTPEQVEQLLNNPEFKVVEDKKEAAPVVEKVVPIKKAASVKKAAPVETVQQYFANAPIEVAPRKSKARKSKSK